MIARQSARAGPPRPRGHEDATPEWRLVAETVARARRRVALVSVVRALTFAGPITLAAAGAIVIWFADDPPLRRLAGAAAAVAAVSSVAVWLRRPSPRQVGELIDRKLDLADRVVTALGLGDRDEPMARLVVADAAERVAELDARRVFPFEAHRHARAAVAAAAVTATLAAWAVRGPAVTTSSSVGSGPGAGETGASNAPAGRAGENGTVGARPPSADSRTLTRRERAAAPSAGSRPERTLDEKPAERSEEQAAPANPDRDESARRARGRFTGDGTPALADTARKDDTARSAAGARPQGDQPSSGPRDADGPSRRPESAAAAARTKSEAAGRGGGMNRGGPQARGIAAAGRVIASGAGGIAGGTVATGASARPRTSVRSAGVGTGDVRDARANAEAAIARDEVPPQRRGYVREYFRTVESMSRP